MASTHVRSASPPDLDRLAALEVEAGQVFHSVGMPEVADDVPDRESLRRSQGQGLIWVAEEQGEIAGYILATVLDGNAHIGQVSVAPAYARQGIGSLLISHLETWGRSNRRPATTLTTFRDIPWNGPFYVMLGYRELPGSEIGSELSAEMQHEATLPGIDASRRCAMIKPNACVSRVRPQLDLNTFEDPRNSPLRPPRSCPGQDDGAWVGTCTTSLREVEGDATIRLNRRLWFVDEDRQNWPIRT
jgi:GNAT superfamily N-acetyltransferase